MAVDHDITTEEPEEDEAVGRDDEGDSVEPPLPPPQKLSRRDRKRKGLLEAAARDYGSDFVRELERMRDARERIVYVAEAVFARKGFAGARTQEIADVAGINKAMIHYYFESKEKLYHAVLDRLLFDLIKLTQECSRDDAGPAEQLELFYRGFFDYIATHRNFSRLSAMEQGTGDRYLSRMVETFFKPLFDRGEAFIRRGIAEGVFDKKTRPRHFLVSVYGMTIAYFADAEFIEKLFGEDPLSAKLIKERREALLDQMFRSLGCKRP